MVYRQHVFRDCSADVVRNSLLSPNLASVCILGLPRLRFKIEWFPRLCSGDILGNSTLVFFGIVCDYGRLLSRDVTIRMVTNVECACHIHTCR